MNLQQLEYILAVDEHRHFVRAAEACSVTQPTLSAMIQKLEEELGTAIFDRSKQPVRPTEAGEAILIQARRVLKEAQALKEIVSDQGNEIRGSLNLGIIPTLAPYLLPLFLKSFTDTYPGVHLEIHELTTEEILRRLERDQLDAGLLVTPVKKDGFYETPLFYEPFRVYAGKGMPMPDKAYLAADDIDLNHLWLLEEGHCLRTQVMRLCELKKQNSTGNSLNYASGSIESLIRMVDAYQGITILPELAVIDWEETKKARLYPFIDPVPQREISFVTARPAYKQRILEALGGGILGHLPASVSRVPEGMVVPI